MFNIIISDLFYFQAASAALYLILVMALFCCPYKEDEFEVYNKARKMRMWALGLLFLQFVAQMLFGFRQRNVMYGIACNMFFIYPSAQQAVMSVHYLIRRKKSYKKEWIITTVGNVINFFAVMSGVYLANGAFLKYALLISYASYYVVFLYLYVVLFLEYRSMKNRLKNYFAAPIEIHTQWINVYIVGQTLIILSVPVVLLHTSVMMIYSMVVYLCFAYFVFKMMYYGYYLKMVDESDSIAIEDEESQSAADSIQGSALSGIEYKVNERLKTDLDRWIKEQGFCDGNVTLVSLARQLGVTSKMLSAYINMTQDASFRDWLNALRTDYACDFIKRYPKRSMEQVAECCGFNSRPYFDTVFKEKIGMTPAAYRKSFTDAC